MSSAEGATPFGVYIHWPFCLSKCPYCDFNSHVRQAAIAATAARVPGRTVSTIFFGGGTPSLMQPATVTAILESIGRHWTIAPDAEITLEANPTSVEAARFRGYRSAGVNRVSLGMQSLDDGVLKQLGRLHTAAEALAAVGVAREIFDRYSFDLIYARPGQTLAAWRDELGRALAHAGEHLSLYQLTIEPETPFAALHASGKLTLPGDDLGRDLYDLTLDHCAVIGNGASDSGGGLFNGTGCNSTALNCLFASNTASRGAGSDCSVRAEKFTSQPTPCTSRTTDSSP